MSRSQGKARQGYEDEDQIWGVANGDTRAINQGESRSTPSVGIFCRVLR